MAIVYLGLGSNLGDRSKNLSRARTALRKVGTLVQESTIIQTKAEYVENQNDYLNQVIAFETNLRPYDLLAFIKDTERNLGRIPTYRYGAREIDIDILYYDQQVITTPLLTIPHPLIYERRFVLIPLFEIAPDFRCPLRNETVREQYHNLIRTAA